MRYVMFFIWLLAATAVAAAAPPATQPAGDDPRVTPVVLAYRRTRPAVVNIAAEQVVSASFGFVGQDPFADIFPDPFARQVPVKSVGSGFLIHKDGYVATNAHVIRKAKEISVTLADGTKCPATVISSDARYDLAVLKITPPEGMTLQCLPLGRSDDLMVGEAVIAIGNPLGYANTLTTGVVSAVDRKLEFEGGLTYEGIIQTDAPINPGNSGGPLLNIKGELVGMTTAIRADAQNIGFAIPIDAIAEELARLLDCQRINRVVFGASIRIAHGEAGDEVVVDKVEPGTPAAEMLKSGDRVAMVNGEKVVQVPDYIVAMLGAPAGKPVNLSIVRDGQVQAVTVTLRERPRPDGKLMAQQMFGLTLRTITPELARDHKLASDKGLLVVGIEEAGPGNKLGLALMDVLFQVGPFFVSDLDELGQVLEGVEGGQFVRIGILRKRQAVWVPIQARFAPVGRPTTTTAPTTSPAKGKTK